MSRPASDYPDSHAWETLIWAIRVWLLSYLTAQLVAAGLAPGLRGAFVGAGPTITRAQLLGSYVSQFNALLALVLIVYLGMTAARQARRLSLGVGNVLVSTIPAAVLYHASRDVLPDAVGFVAVIATSAVLLLSAAQTKGAGLLRTAALLFALSFLLSGSGYLLQEGQFSDPALRANAGLLELCRWGGLGLIYSTFARRRPWSGALIPMVALLPAAAAERTQEAITDSKWVTAFGHCIQASVGSEAEFGQTFGFSFAFLLVLSSIFSRVASFPLLAGSILSLCCFSPMTPIGSAAATLGAFVLLVFSEERDLP